MTNKPDLFQPNFTSGQWTLVEDYYRENLDKIHIPDDPKPYDITSINSQLEKLYHEARFDYLEVCKKFDSVSNAYKKLKRALYPLAKSGKNAEEREHLLQDYLMITTLDKIDPVITKALGLPTTPVSIYIIYEGYKNRVDFMKSVLDIISDKTSRLITDSGAMKIESRLGA